MLENNLTPFVITVEDRAKYMDILRSQDIENFINLVEPLIEKEKKRISAFKIHQIYRYKNMLKLKYYIFRRYKNGRYFDFRHKTSYVFNFDKWTNGKIA